MTEHEQTVEHACFGTSRDPIDYEKLVAFLQAGYDAGQRSANLQVSMVGQMANDVLEARSRLDAVRAVCDSWSETIPGRSKVGELLAEVSAVAGEN